MAGAREVQVWQRGDGPLRTRWWQRPPSVEVLMNGEWRPALLAYREDRADGTVVYHVDVYLPGHSSPARRSYVWDPATIRPAGEEQVGEPIDTFWDAEGRVLSTTRPSA